MKIIRLTTLLDFGGIETKMVNLSRFDDKKNEWIFVAIGGGGEAEKKIRANKKQTIILGLDYRIPSLKTIWKVFKYLRKEKPDILHTSGAEANFFGFFAGRLARVPKIIVEEIGISSQSSTAKKIFGFVFKNADLTIGESKVVVEHFVSSYHLNPSKAIVVPNFGLFEYDLTKVNIIKEDGLFNILMISRLEKVKNIEAVINVVSRLKNTTSKNVKLTIAGSGVLEQELKKKVKEMRLESNVNFLGFITDPYPILLTADLYLLNSHSEGFSNSLIEAMYTATPSMSTSVGAAADIIENGANGFLIPANNEEKLYSKLLEILEISIDDLTHIGINGQKTIMEKYSLNNHIEQLLFIYSSI